jgi:two-component system sensor histidine kinase/response regulator
MNEPEARPKILIVDDKPQNLYALANLLQQLEVDVRQATSGAEALALTLEQEFCLAIVDVQMPEMDGYELVELWRGNPSTASLPVIFVSAIYSDEYHHRKGYDAGAVDFLSKPFVPEILLSKIRVFIDLYHQRVKLQELVNELNVKNEALENEIKQRQQVEAALRKANSDKDKLFAIISHDLNNPFQVLLGNSKLMLKQMEHLTKTDLQDMANHIHRSAQTVHNLLKNLLTWSQLQQGGIEYDPGPVELHKLAENTVALLQEMAFSKKIRLEHTIEAGLFVHADAYMIETVIRNLTANALKFTPSGGQVTLSARQKNSISPDQAETEWVEVAVTDTGVGISPEDIDKLFRIGVHHTTPGTAQETGTGLGLILCQEMVEKNGGQLWVESELDRGTAVKFTVPIACFGPTASPELAGTETLVADREMV